MKPRLLKRMTIATRLLGAFLVMALAPAEHRHLSHLHHRGALAAGRGDAQPARHGR